MEKFLKPARLDIDPNSPTAGREWKHWHRTLLNFIEECGDNAPDKFRILVNCVTHNVYEYFEDCTSFDSAIAALERVYIKTPNEIFARHLLATHQQRPGESLDEFLRELRKLGKDCNFQAVSAEQYKEELIRDAFINGLVSPMIRQRLLENKTLDLKSAYDQAYSLDLAQRNASAYSSQVVHTAAVVTPDTPQILKDSLGLVDGDVGLVQGGDGPNDISKGNPTMAAAVSFKKKCYFCGGIYHNRTTCPAREVTCHRCEKKGHFSRVCRSKSSTSRPTTATVFGSSLLATVASGTSFPQSLHQAATSVIVSGQKLSALVDSCSDDSYIDEEAAYKLKLKVHQSGKDVTLAQKSLNINCKGFVIVDLTLNLNGQAYPATRLGLMRDLCCGVLLGQDFQKQHESVHITYGGPKPALNLPSTDSYCALAAAAVEEPSIFQNLSPKCRPIATKSRQFGRDDKEFIENETNRLLAEGIIETSVSPWRAQVVVVKDPLDRHKRRMCIDYSQTINQYTELDAYPLPRIDSIVNDLSKYRVFSTFDLKSAYHQVSLKESDRKYTAFEANGRLYQFCRIPFGVTNGVAAFQRAMDNLVIEEDLKGAFPYLDNITIAGHTQEEHDQNVQRFLEVINRRRLTLNDSKTVKSVHFINILGYCVGNNVIRPDPERLRPLQELPPPSNLGSLKRTLGMFAYYARWIQDFSSKVQPLAKSKKFPLNEEALQAFDLLKKELEAATLHSVDETLPFEVECDASEVAISAVLNQGGRPVAFMSRTLQGSEVHYHIVEKEAMAIIEAVRKWSHFLGRRHFDIVTDQRSVSFMFDNRRRTKIKNNKIQEWRMELSSFSYTVHYRPGKENVVPDALTRAYCCSSFSTTTLSDLHNGLCHPGVTRFLHFVRSKNLPYSTEDVKRVCASCKVCAELKPRFYQPPAGTLIKATQPMERLSIDFKGPLPTATRNSYLLTVIDEYSRFPFAFPCPNMSTATVIKCLEQIFSLCGMPNYVHSDQGASFMSKDLKAYLSQKGVATSRTTPYHPIGNGQVERFNATVWKAVQLALKSRNLPDQQWESVLTDVLHSIRSLLSTATNTTPHERFFGFSRRSSSGSSLPSWLMTPGPVLLRRFVRTNKNDPLVDQVELLDVNPTYANIRHKDGRETTVSVRDLAPYPGDHVCDPNGESATTENLQLPQPMEPEVEDHAPDTEAKEKEVVSPVLRRSERMPKVPNRYGWD